MINKPATPQAPVSPPPVRRRKWRRVARGFEHVLAGAGVAMILVFATPLLRWIHQSLERPDALQPARYCICLGGDMERVIEAARLVRDGTAEKLIVSNVGDAATWMRDIAVDWGAPPDRVLVDDQSRRTADHPGGAARLGVDPKNDVCIIVTSYAHLARSEAVFRKAGYRHLIMREPRWERETRTRRAPEYGLVWRFMEAPAIIYESAAWVRYWLQGDV